MVTTPFMNTNTSKTVSFHTLGCRLNFSESGEIANGFSQRNYSVVPWGQPSDVTFINTCTVTDAADSSCRNIIRAAQKFSPGGKIVVAGCMAQMESKQIAQIGGVDLILGNHEKHKVFEYLEDENEDENENEANNKNIIHIEKSNEFWGAASGLGDDKTRAFLKIQDGCNYVCSFCIIPFARGRSRCIDIESAKLQIKELIQSGKKEIVITGVNIGEFTGPKGENLSSFIQSVWDPQSPIRLRLSSMEPNTITPELMNTLKNIKGFQDHFHIPLQSGSDTVLKSMKRKYTAAQYSNAIGLIREYFPHAGVGGDIIVGHPGETQEDFQRTYDLVEALNLTHIHVFPYSRRKGTVSDKMPDQISTSEKKRRSSILRTLGEKNYVQWVEKIVNINYPIDVLFENKKDDGYYYGYTTNYIRVKTKEKQREREKDLQNTIHPVQLIKAEDFHGGDIECQLIL